MEHLFIQPNTEFWMLELIDCVCNWKEAEELTLYVLIDRKYILPMEQGIKMSESDNTSIDISKLATSLRGEFQKLHPLSDKCCIYRVPPRTRELNKGGYTPKAVSIGPLHHDRAEFQVMEERKKRYLQSFLERTEVSIDDLLQFITNNETRLRNSYAETIELGSEEFVKMILLDAIFLLELLFRGTGVVQHSDDRIFTKPWMINDIVMDLSLLENQLPMFILEDLFKLVKPPSGDYAEVSFMMLSRNFWRSVGKPLLIGDDLLETYFSEAKNFVDWLGLCLQPLKKSNRHKLKSLTTPTITELYHSGVKFKPGSCRNLMDIRFDNGILEIPKLTLYMVQAEVLFRNLQQFERLHGETNHVNDYITIINYLVNTPNDVELLMKNGVIENWLGNTEGVPHLFGNLLKECAISPSNFYYAGLIEDLNAHCNFRQNKWKATLEQDYFNTPWSVISVIAAVILLVLTFIQTVFSVV